MAAYAFWAALSAKFWLKSTYDANRRIDSTEIDHVISQLGKRVAQEFSLLGILIDNSGKMSPYHHNENYQLRTITFGDCVATGSGSEQMLQLIGRSDEATVIHGGWPSNYPISATEDLAEYICSEMLYRDSDCRNGTTPDSPLSHSIGGFYEWYRIGADGILPMPSRLELNIEHFEDHLRITRAYYVEQVEIPLANASTTHLGLHVMTLLFEPYVIAREVLDGGGYTIALQGPHGTLIESTLRSYDSATEPRMPHLSGPVPDEMLGKFFAGGCDIHRVRSVVVTNRVAKGRRFVTTPATSPDATLQYVKSKLLLWMSARVLAK